MEYADLVEVNVKRFLQESCVRDDAAMTPFADLFAAFNAWRQAEGVHFPDTQNGFARGLTLLDVTRYRRSAKRMIIGVRLKEAT